MAEWPVGHAAVGILRLGRPDRGRGPTVTELAGATGPVDRPFPWASVTKPATALAALVAVEEGSLSLDEAAGPPGSTVRHLLAHASGLGPRAGPPLAPPGTRRIYSNAGYGVVADLIAERSGLDFSEYLSEGVLGPLGMAGTVLRHSAGGAAAGLVGPLDDLLVLAREWSTPTLVSAETHGDAASTQFAGLAGVLPGFGRFEPCDWGLGVEIRGHKQPHWTGTTNVAGDVRTLRSERRLPVGRPGCRHGLRRTLRSTLRVRGPPGPGPPWPTPSCARPPVGIRSPIPVRLRP